MPENRDWQAFFDEHAPLYDDNVFVQATDEEIPFLVDELDLAPGASILDVGCGTGRHTVGLAERGYALTGLDLSEGMLAQATARAERAGVSVEWVQADATAFALPTRYDAAICICEGSFGLLGQGDDPVEQPLAILRNIARCLKPDARLLMTVLNAGRLLRMYSDEDVAAGKFDPLTLVESGEMAPREGAPPAPTRERAFVPTELILLMRLAGLSVRNLWGGTAGNWGRRPLELDEYEIMVVAEKTGEPLA